MYSRRGNRQDDYAPHYPNANAKYNRLRGHVGMRRHRRATDGEPHGGRAADRD
ncbi:Hypothetical protein RY70_62 [Bifidobacterium bifidum]|nr:Hypothetical protein RY70_62 [Bifidobacterium bifidum]